ncbi:MAG: BON domain-containing protein [Gammaproteobacteria bacterium]|nr:BON domain-containing protein [Gammaproteobacteria bacterium]
MRKIPLIFAAILMLQGCIPAVFVAGAATGFVVFDHRSARTMAEDRDVTFQIQNKFYNDKELRGQAHVSVTTFNHIALLLGQAPTAELRSKAEAIVKSNSKVKMLYNEVTIEKPISDMARANDTWITTKVKTVLAATPGLNSATLKIVTENKVVYLMGLTTRTQATLAAEKTRTVAGVVKVVKLFEYLN